MASTLRVIFFLSFRQSGSVRAARWWIRAAASSVRCVSDPAWLLALLWRPSFPASDLHLQTRTDRFVCSLTASLSSVVFAPDSSCSPPQWICQFCTFVNTRPTPVCEMCDLSCKDSAQQMMSSTKDPPHRTPRLNVDLRRQKTMKEDGLNLIHQIRVGPPRSTEWCDGLTFLWQEFGGFCFNSSIEEVYVTGSGNVRNQSWGGLRRHHVQRKQHQALRLAEVRTASPAGWYLCHRRLRPSQLLRGGQWVLACGRDTRQRGAASAERRLWRCRWKRETFKGRSQGGMVGGRRRHGESSETAAERQTEKSKSWWPLTASNL